MSLRRSLFFFLLAVSNLIEAGVTLLGSIGINKIADVFGLKNSLEEFIQLTQFVFYHSGTSISIG